MKRLQRLWHNKLAKATTKSLILWHRLIDKEKVSLFFESALEQIAHLHLVVHAAMIGNHDVSLGLCGGLEKGIVCALVANCGLISLVLIAHHNGANTTLAPLGEIVFYLGGVAHFDREVIEHKERLVKLVLAKGLLTLLPFLREDATDLCWLGLSDDVCLIEGAERRLLALLDKFVCLIVVVVVDLVFHEVVKRKVVKKRWAKHVDLGEDVSILLYQKPLEQVALPRS